jgi:hypothetical protein
MEEWYYTTNNQQMGPVSWDELRQLASTGLLKPSDLVWKDGIGDWVKAERREGLFTTRPRAARTAEPRTAEPRTAEPRRAELAAEADDRPRGRSRRDDDDYDDDRPRRRRDEDDDYDDDRPRRRRRRASEGMPVGAKVAIIGGSVALGVLILIVVIVFVVRGGGSGGVQNFTVIVPERQEHFRFIRLSGGQNVRISVRSTVHHPATDVDLFVERANGIGVAADIGLSKDCNVNFIAPATDSYKLKVRNLGPGSATCVVTFN